MSCGDFPAATVEHTRVLEIMSITSTTDVYQAA